MNPARVQTWELGAWGQKRFVLGDIWLNVCAGGVVSGAVLVVAEALNMMTPVNGERGRVRRRAAHARSFRLRAPTYMLGMC